MSKTLEEISSEWQDFYKKYFDLGCDFSQVRIPETRPGFDRILIIAEGLTLQRVAEVFRWHCAPIIDNFIGPNLDKAFPYNDRDPLGGAYAICVHNNRKPEIKLRNLKPHELKERNIKTITLLEQMIFELKYFSETGDYLESEGVVECSGSSDGYAGYFPRVCWWLEPHRDRGEEFLIATSNLSGDIGTREVVE